MHEVIVITTTGKEFKFELNKDMYEQVMNAHKKGMYSGDEIVIFDNNTVCHSFNKDHVVYIQY